MNLPKTSPNGRALLEELSSAGASERRCLTLIGADPLAPLLRSADGDNALHLAAALPEGPDLAVARAVLAVAPAAARARNALGRLPLHVAVAQTELNYALVQLLLEHHPEGAAVADQRGLVPLLLLAMHEDPAPALAALCRLLCVAFPQGPACMSESRSHPLHFAARRAHPNTEVLRILLRRFPAAAQHANAHGLLPLHCACASTGDAEPIRLLLEAHPAAAAARDPKGRSCLHLALLRIGERDLALAGEEAAEALDLSAADLQDEQEEQPDSDAAPMRERAGVSRAVLHLLVAADPRALVTPNNFLAVPVETALERTKPSSRRLNKVAVFGLHDDPISSRILLQAHVLYARRGTLPSPPQRHLRILKELNWQARKWAVLASVGRRDGDDKGKGKGKGKGCAAAAPRNILERLRRHGGVDCLKLCILWI